MRLESRRREGLVRGVMCDSGSLCTEFGFFDGTARDRFEAREKKRGALNLFIKHVLPSHASTGATVQTVLTIAKARCQSC